MSLELDPLATGLTRPPMMLGVPLSAFYLSVLICSLGWMLVMGLVAGSGTTGLIIFFGFLGLWFMLFAFMACITFRDPYGLTIAWLNITSFRKHSTHRFWGNTDAYAP